MDYGLTCDGTVCDFNYLRHVGWGEQTDCFKKFFSKTTVKLISKKVTELTLGIDKYNRKILVPDARICEVMDAIYQNFRPTTGDIYSRYVVPNNEQADMVQSMIDQTIEVIVEHIRSESEMVSANEKLSAWVQVYGDFNTHNLTQVPPIKTLQKRPAVMQFNMNY